MLEHCVHDDCQLASAAKSVAASSIANLHQSNYWRTIDRAFSPYRPTVRRNTDHRCYIRSVSLDGEILRRPDF